MTSAPSEPILKGVRVLVVDDEEPTLLFFKGALTPRGAEVFTCRDGSEVASFLKEQSVDLVITDVMMDTMHGDELLRWMVGNHPTVPVIILTAFATIDHAVNMMKMGAYDYIAKPITDLGEVLRIIARAAGYRRLLVENQTLKRQLNRSYQFQIVGQSRAMQRVFALLETIAPTDVNVLITGSSGTGKELIAQAIHYNSPRASRPFIQVNCAALPATLFESELFGYEKGAFTGANKTYIGKIESANGGTLMLDEIGDLPLALQPKFLRVLQERNLSRLGSNKVIDVDFRLVATTNADLKGMVERREFREDLYYRLNVMAIHLPPLAERTEDIPALAYHFLRKYAAKHKLPAARFSPAALRFLCQAPWLGNVRELENIVERSVVLSRGEVVQLQDFFIQDEPPDLNFDDRNEDTAPSSIQTADDGLTLAELEKRHILATLERLNGHRARTAQALGISVRTLRNKLHEYRIADDQD